MSAVLGPLPPGGSHRDRPVETVNEVTHRMMVAEALSKGLIERGAAKRLRERPELIPGLTDYWKKAARVKTCSSGAF